MNVALLNGVKTKVQLIVNIPESVTCLKAVEFTSAAVERPTIKLSDLEIPK